MNSILPHITVETGNSPRHSIIWLHGLGADGEDFVPIAKEINLPTAVRYIFPHAPMRPVTINGGYVMRAWYDILPGNFRTAQDEAGMRASQSEIEKLILQEKQRGVAASRIFLAGFSQGGAIALLTGLQHAERLGGILALSAYLPLAQEGSAAARRTPIFMAHGRDDPVIDFSTGHASAQILVTQGFQVDWHEYDMPHSVCHEEILDIQTWLSGNIADSQEALSKHSSETQ